MGVRIGSARSSYGNTSPGDQSGGKEVSIQAHYNHPKGWYVYRAKDSAARERIAVSMEHACDNDDIGYSQGSRNTLRENVKDAGFDPAKTTKKVNTDCSALVRVCCNYAGIGVGDFTTANEGSKLMATGAFEKFTDKAHCVGSDYLLRGDILCTRTKGHTVVVLDDGAKAGSEAASEVKDGALRRGDEGEDVRELQRALIALGYDCGSYGADGDYGADTEKAVKAYQTNRRLTVDGIAGDKTLAAIEADLNALGDDMAEESAPSGNLRVADGTWNLRRGPGTEYAIAGIAKGGEWLRSAYAPGWVPVIIDDAVRWISERGIRG